MYSALGKILRLYWKEYGGTREFLASPFLHTSALASVAYSFGFLEFEWRAFATGSLPTILGLSLAAYAITFSLMGSALHRALTAAIDEQSGISLVKIVNSTFFHVVVFQIFALLFAIFSKGTAFSELVTLLPLNSSAAEATLSTGIAVGDVLGFFLVTYSTLLLLSIGLAMYRLGRLNPSSEPGPVADPANDDGVGTDVTQTLRFRFVARIARFLRIYD